MPPYFYHLKFELYATSDPIAATAPPPSADDVAELWIPPRDTSIFEVLPSHSSRLLRSPPPHAESRPQSASHPPAPAPAGSSSIPSGSPGSLPPSLPAVIDCGAYRRPSDRGPPDGGASLVRISELGGGGQPRVPSFPPPSSSAAIRPGTAVSDWRFGQLTIESVDLEDMTTPQPDAEPAPPAGEPAHDRGGHASEGLGPRFPGSGTSTRAQFLPIQSRSTSIGWGVVHFYRESKETPALSLPPGLVAPAASSDGDGGEQDCTTLCIPAVPSYMSPSDFLGFVGEKWKADMSHYRMVMSPKMNRYLVLMKARNHNRAREWRKEFDGKVFNTMESQVCHVVFVRSITFESPPPMAADAGAKPSAPASPALSKFSTWGSLKPFPPPTPDLVELPTCPVCLERMDDTTGLMTIPCQHIFHCSCLQNWSGSGCPVCRHTNPDGTAAPLEFGAGIGAGAGIGIAGDALAQPFGGSAVSNLCRVCDCTEDLWICLVCGTVGCGRYRGGHAKEHWKETAHSFALELGTQYVWDYAGDTWVHRLIREKGGGKLMDLPESTNRPGSGNGSGNDRGNGNGPRPGSAGEEEMVPRAKLDNIGLEYAHLISSQLESQRAYYEEMVNKAADKASRAAAEADRAAAQAAAASRQLRELQDKFQTLSAGTVPQLERDLERERSRAVKAQDLARSLGRSLQEEKGVGEGLLVRVQHVNTEKEELQRRIEELKGEIVDLREMNSDLTAFISGQEKLKELEASGKVTEAELEGSNVGVQGKERRRRRKN